MGNENPPKIEESYDIRIARDGSWWHNGGRIERMGLIRLFASVLRRDEHGDYWLVTPAERGRITVEDAPFVAVEMVREGTAREQVLRFRTNLDHWVTAGADHEISTRTDSMGESKPYIGLNDGLEAACTRSVYYELMELVEEWTDNSTGMNEMNEMGVWSKGRFFPLQS